MASVPTRVRRALPGPLSPDRVRRGAYVLGATCIVAVAAWLVFKWSRLPVDAELQRVGRSPALPVLTITNTGREDWARVWVRVDDIYIAERPGLEAGLGWRLTPDALVDTRAWLHARSDPYYAARTSESLNRTAPPDYEAKRIVVRVGEGEAARERAVDVRPAAGPADAPNP